jgi:hypothetical protein
MGENPQQRQTELMHPTRMKKGVVAAAVVAASVCAGVPASATTRARLTAQFFQPPSVNVLHRSALDAPGYIFIAPKSSGSQGPEIVDDRGRPVWFDPLPSGEEADDFRVQTYNGKPVLTWWQGTSFGGVSRGADYILDSSYHVIANGARRERP